ncbi:MAG TPA: hypothetical protein VJ770_10410 [Stellaceae bacterium]|nr:hypothetical protein [Stellaceae bacterium]
MAVAAACSWLGKAPLPCLGAGAILADAVGAACGPRSEEGPAPGGGIATAASSAAGAAAEIAAAAVARARLRLNI